MVSNYAFSTMNIVPTREMREQLNFYFHAPSKISTANQNKLATISFAFTRTSNDNNIYEIYNANNRTQVPVPQTMNLNMRELALHDLQR